MATPIPENRLTVSTGEVVDAVGGAVVRGDRARTHAGITSDTRAVKPGSVFFALRGERFDGHAFVAAASTAGASLAVVGRGRGGAVPAGVDVVEVDDTLVAWGALARERLRRWRAAPGRRVVAVTGSAGKTTTKAICAALLAAAEGVGRVHATAGNLNNRVGLPATLFALEDDREKVVLEMGTSFRGEIAALASIATPDVAILTNVGLAHAEGIGGEGTPEAARAAVGIEKGALFEALPPSGCAIVNADDDQVELQVRRSRAGVAWRFGRAERAEYRLLEHQDDVTAGARVRYVTPATPEPVSLVLPVLGEAFAVDFLAALAAATAAMGRPLASTEIASALAGFAPMEGRGKITTLADGTLVIDDSYNANPLSMAQSVELLQRVAARDGRRAVAVLGEMRELGGFAEEAHVTLGEQIARARVGLAIGCGGLIDASLARAEQLGIQVLRGADADDALALARRHLRPGDVVLVKGSRGVRTERVVEGLSSDRGVVVDESRAPSSPRHSGTTA